MNETDASEVVEDVLAVELDDQLTCRAEITHAAGGKLITQLVEIGIERGHSKVLGQRCSGPLQQKLANLFGGQND